MSLKNRFLQRFNRLPVGLRTLLEILGYIVVLGAAAIFLSLTA